MIRACPDCGTGNSPGNRFCTQCGQRLELVSPASQPASAQPPRAKKLCAGCHTANEAPSAYCYRCGLKLPDRLYPQPEMAGSPGGFWARAVAYVVDSLLVATVSLLPVAIFTGADLGAALDRLFGDTNEWWPTLVTFWVDAAYYTFATGQRGQTVGKAILGLKVTRVDGSRLTYRRSFARYLAYLVSWIPLGLGFISIGLSSQKRGWHDLLCDTRVVKVRG